jgi:RNA exonuclease 1
VPTSVRQRYLGSIIDECLKLTGGDELAAYARAEREEVDCSRKASSRMIYLNLAVNCIKRLRGEAGAAAPARAPPPAPGSLAGQLARQGETSHLAVLAGKGAAMGSWSIQPKGGDTRPEDLDETTLYNVMAKYILTEEQLEENGFPRPDPEREGMVRMRVDPRGPRPDPDKLKIVAASEDRRLCCRCGAIYRVDGQGLQEEAEKCVYHWGRCFKARSSRLLDPFLSSLRLPSCYITGGLLCMKRHISP